MKHTIAVDFDGVIHSYSSPWAGHHVIPDPPIPGAFEFLHRTIQRFDVVIFSTRCGTWRGRRAVRSWIRREAGAGLWYESAGGYRGLEELTLTDRKPPALVYLDDRAIRFAGPGTFPSVNELMNARPWNKPR